MTALFPSSAWSRPDSTTSRSSTSRMIKARITWRLGWVFYFYFLTDMHLGHHLINSICLCSDTALKDAVCCSLLTGTIWLGGKSPWEAPFLLWMRSPFFIHLCRSDHGKHDNRLTLNPLTPLSSLSPSVSISSPTAVFFPLYFSVAFHCISSVILFSSSTLHSFTCSECVFFPLQGKIRDEWCLILKFQQHVSGVSGRKDNLKRPLLNICNACLSSPGLSASRWPSPGVVLFVHGLCCQCESLEVYNIFTLFTVCLQTLAYLPWAILLFY